MHRRREGLCAAHTAQAGGDHQTSFKTTAEVPRGDGPERLVGALYDALRADVYPRTGRHLPVHRESGALQPAKLIPVGPAAHEIAVGNEDTRRVLVRAEHRHGLAALYEQRLVVGQCLQRAHDCIERFP